MRGRRLAALLICVMFVLLLGTACRSGEPVDVTNDAGTVNEESSSAADESEVIAGNGETENTEETERTREAENTVETETSETETSETETSETLIGSRLGTIDISGNGDILQGEEYLIINNTEEFQIFGEQTGLEKTLEYNKRAKKKEKQDKTTKDR